MNRKSGIATVIVPMLLLSSALTFSPSIPHVHGAGGLTGIVCIADPSGPQKCPETPPILTPITPSDKQITIGVFVNSSAGLNGFVVILVADHTIIKPWKVDMSSTIVPGCATNPCISVECIGGVLKVGTTCSNLDGPDTLHLEAITTQGKTFPPTTGLLFAATYNITGTARNTPIDFMRGCSGLTSVTGVCVTITSGNPQPDPETIQAAGFSNLPFYAIDASPATLITDIGASNSSLITLTSLNSFVGTVTLSGSINPSGPVVMPLSPSIVPLTAGGQGFSSLSISVGTMVAPGNYNVTVTATTNATFPSNSVLVRLIVPPPDFSVSSSPTTVIINATASGSARLTLTSLNSFAGTVGLTLVRSQGLVASLNASQVTLKPGGSNSSASLTVSASTGGIYTATITAKSGALSHQLDVSVVALTFGVVSKLASISIPQGVNQSYTFAVTNDIVRCCYHGNVTLSTSISPLTNAPAASCGPSLVVFTSPTSQSVDVVCWFKGSTLGDYTVVLGGVSRSGALFNAATLVVHVQAPDFLITASPQSQTIQAGSSANVTIIIARQSIFNGTLSLSASVSPSGPTTAFNATSFTINGTYNAAAAALTITVPPSFPPGPLTVTITVVNGTSPGALTHQTMVQITVATPSTFHDVSIGSVTTDTTSPSVGDKVHYTIIVYDLGNFQEQVIVVALVADTTVDQKNATIQPGGNATLTLTWDTSGWASGTYVVGAKVLSVPGERNTGNNLSRSTRTLTLNPTSQGLFSSGNLTLPIGIGVALIALIGATVYLSRYRTRTRAQTV